MFDDVSVDPKDPQARTQLTCPHCFNTGLEVYPAFAAKYDSQRDRLAHGSRCPDCDQRADPEQIRDQLASKRFGLGQLSINLDWMRGVFSSSTFRYSAVVLLLIFLLVYVPMFALPAIGGGGGTGGGGDPAATDDDQNGNEIVVESGEWNIEETDDGYIITDGERYLTPDGVQGDPYTFDDLDGAELVLDGFIEAGEPDDWVYNVSAPDLPDEDSRDVGYLSGVVIDEYEEPYDGGEIEFIEAGMTVEANADGEYALDEHLDAGTYEVYAHAGGSSSVPFELEVDEDGQVWVVNDARSALYVESDDGSVAQNRVSFIVASDFNIGASGDVGVELD